MGEEWLMGMSYIQLLKEHYRKLSLWSGNEPNIDIFKKIDPTACERFIRQFFRLYEKEQGNQLLSLLDSVDKDRQRHIVYTFLLGVAIYKESDFVRKRIDKELNLYKDALANQENEFEFVWFLICLFHDLAYPVEMKDEKAKNYETRDYQELSKKMGDFCLPGLVAVPAIYYGMIDKYYDYKRQIYKDKSCDHGIIAGAYLYRDMCINRDVKRSMTQSNRFWKPELNRVYKFAASIVTCHNIWLQPKQEDVPKYIHCGMQSLMMPRGSRPIRFCDYPTFFLFCLVDSMEMVKRKGVSLDKLKVDIWCDGILLDINECSQTDKYILRYNFLAIDDWLTDAKETADSIITISIK